MRRAFKIEFVYRDDHLTVYLACEAISDKVVPLPVVYSNSFQPELFSHGRLLRFEGVVPETLEEVVRKKISDIGGWVENIYELDGEQKDRLFRK